MAFPEQIPPFYSPAPQVQRHEVARLRQLMVELEMHRTSMYQQLSILATQLSTPEKQFEYVALLNKIRENEEGLRQHSQYLSQVLAMVPMDYPRQVSDQAKREIYHLYHAGRYTQEQLAAQYGVSQSTVNRIVNGEAPPQLSGVNPHSLT